jgi:MoxR-like ATPase
MTLLDNIEKSFIDELNDFTDDEGNRSIIPEGIALNKPLRENIFALFACYSTLTPLLICGKPGTSKTLCAQIFSTCMKTGFSESLKSLGGMPDSVELYYGGS